MLSKEENGQSVNNRSVNVVNNLLSEEQIADMATLFKMMSDPTRLRIINMLLISELCVHDLAEFMQMSQSAISHQLAALRNSRLIKFRREGKQIFYSLDDEHIGQLFKQCLEHAKEK
ncbi:MAG: metalloregulator ArsR/SmtB family transcription factor [Firmicutes bacterium]|jgi:Predicted transcriptional regulators|nr:metalloregulator ArsR/SmtB family transcription factor [Bacillota bacterium]